MIKDLYKGMSAYGTALQFTVKHRLWSYFVIPALISLLLGSIIIYGAWLLSDDIGQYIGQIYPWEWGRAYVDEFGRVLGGLFIAALGLILFKNLVVALASPFMSFLSEKVERILYGSDAPQFTLHQFFSDLVRGIRIAIRLLLRELLFTFLLFLLGLIPVFAPIIPFALFTVQAYYAGAGNLDFTLERYFRVRGSVAFVRRHRGIALGNGLVYLLLFFTGIGFVFALPLGTIAGTQEALKKIRQEEAAVY
jgi:CysZ protein